MFYIKVFNFFFLTFDFYELDFLQIGGKMNTYENILELVIDKTNPRLWAHNHFKLNDRVVSVSDHTIVSVPSDKVESNTDNNVPVKRLNEIFGIDYPEDLQIPVIKLQNALNLIPLEDEFIEKIEESICESCDGSGEVEWSFEEFKRTDECPKCEGSGKSFTGIMVKSGKVIKHYDKYSIKILNTSFVTERINTLIEIATLLGVDTIKIECQTDNKVQYGIAKFKISDVDIYLMPSREKLSDRIVSVIK